MFKKFIMKLKIRRAEKRLDHLLDLRDLNYDYQDIKDDIEKTIRELNNLDDHNFVIRVKKKHDKESIDKSIFERCNKCHKLILQNENHKCNF